MLSRQGLASPDVKSCRVLLPHSECREQLQLTLESDDPVEAHLIGPLISKPEVPVAGGEADKECVRVGVEDARLRHLQWHAVLLGSVADLSFVPADTWVHLQAPILEEMKRGDIPVKSW